MMCVCCPPALRDIFPIPMARYSLFMLKVPLNSNKSNQPNLQCFDAVGWVTGTMLPLSCPRAQLHICYNASLHWPPGSVQPHLWFYLGQMCHVHVCYILVPPTFISCAVQRFSISNHCLSGVLFLQGSWLLPSHPSCNQSVRTEIFSSLTTVTDCHKSMWFLQVPLSQFFQYKLSAYTVVFPCNLEK